MTLQVQAKEITVFVIDSGVDTSHDVIKSHINPKDLDSPDFKAYHYHGTFIAGMILNNTCEEVRLLSCTFYIPKRPDRENMDRLLNCYKRAINEKPDLINFSGGGGGLDIQELLLLKQLEVLNIPLVAAAGNNGRDLNDHPFYPASYLFKNIIPVGNLTQDGIINRTSNYGLKNMRWEVGTDIFGMLPNNKFGYMSGTSMSAARISNRILLKRCRDLNGIH